MNWFFCPNFRFWCRVLFLPSCCKIDILFKIGIPSSIFPAPPLKKKKLQPVSELIENCSSFFSQLPVFCQHLFCANASLQKNSSHPFTIRFSMPPKLAFIWSRMVNQWGLFFAERGIVFVLSKKAQSKISQYKQNN